jgi:hypothetical protein
MVAGVCEVTTVHSSCCLSYLGASVDCCIPAASATEQEDISTDSILSVAISACPLCHVVHEPWVGLAAGASPLAVDAAWSRARAASSTAFRHLRV